MLQRTNFNPDDDELLKLMSSDSLKRNQDIASMLRLLMRIDKGLSIFLDGDWGSGKTYFVRSLKIVIDELNTCQEALPAGIDAIANMAFKDGISWHCNYLPIYYNAWSYDYWSDPLASIACTLAAESDEARLGNDPSDSKVIRTALKALLETILDHSIPGIGSAIDKTVQAMGAEDLLDAFKKRSGLRNAVAEAVNLVLKERADKLLLIVDELDRCEPRFACRLLEELKTLFDLDNVVVLYSLNTKQLACVIEGQYGAGFSGKRYLSKFYDIATPIRTVNTNDYLTHMEINPDYQSSLVIKSVIEAHEMSLREASRLIEICKPNLGCLYDTRITNETVFCVGFMDVVEAGIQVSDPTAHDRLTNNGDYSVFAKEVKSSKGIKDCFVSTFGHCIKPDDYRNMIDDQNRVDELIDAVAILRWSNQFDKKNKAYKAINEVQKNCLTPLIERENQVSSLY